MHSTSNTSNINIQPTNHLQTFLDEYEKYLNLRSQDPNTLTDEDLDFVDNFLNKMREMSAEWPTYNFPEGQAPTTNAFEVLINHADTVSNQVRINQEAAQTGMAQAQNQLQAAIANEWFSFLNIPLFAKLFVGATALVLSGYGLYYLVKRLSGNANSTTVNQTVDTFTWFTWQRTRPVTEGFLSKIFHKFFKK